MEITTAVTILMLLLLLKLKLLREAGSSVGWRGWFHGTLGRSTGLWKTCSFNGSDVYVGSC